MKQTIRKLPQINVSRPAFTAVTFFDEKIVESKLPFKYSYAEEFFSVLYPAISDELRQEIRKRSFSINLDKKYMLIREGEVCSSLYLIKKGLLRGFISHGKEEITTWLNCENQLVTPVAGLLNRMPAIENIEALEPCSLEVISGEDLQWLYAHFRETEVIVRLILEAYYRDVEERAFIARLSTAKARYLYLAGSKYSSAINRASLRYVASFLGMRKETLCRIRAGTVQSGTIRINKL